MTTSIPPDPATVTTETTRTAHARTISGINQTKYRRQRDPAAAISKVSFPISGRFFMHLAKMSKSRDMRLEFRTQSWDWTLPGSAIGPECRSRLRSEAETSVSSGLSGRNTGLDHSCPWVGLTHGLGWIGSGWVEIFQFLMGWVGSTIAKVLNFWKAYVHALKARLDKIWLHRAVKYVSCIGLGRVGSKFCHL